jgi:hypothetical protein
MFILKSQIHHLVKMDPIAAFQVEGCALAFIDFTARLITHTYEVYTSPDGLTSRIVDPDDLPKDLNYTSAQIQQKLGALPSASVNESGQRLTRLCGECVEIAGEIEGAIGRLRSQGTTRLDFAKGRFLIAIKGFFGSNRAQELKKRDWQSFDQISRWRSSFLCG